MRPVSVPGVDQPSGRMFSSTTSCQPPAARYNATQPGSSSQIRRVLLIAEPPSIDANEITDKGYINQRAVLERRAALIERLYSDPPAAEVIVIA